MTYAILTTDEMNQYVANPDIQIMGSTPVVIKDELRWACTYRERKTVKKQVWKVRYLSLGHWWDYGPEFDDKDLAEAFAKDQQAECERHGDFRRVEIYCVRSFECKEWI